MGSHTGRASATFARRSRGHNSPPRKRQTPRYADWRINFLLNFGVYFVITFTLIQLLTLVGVLIWGQGFVAFMDWLSGLASGP